MPKMSAILQLVSAPLNPIPIAEHFRRSHPQCLQWHSSGKHCDTFIFYFIITSATAMRF